MTGRISLKSAAHKRTYGSNILCVWHDVHGAPCYVTAAAAIRLLIPPVGFYSVACIDNYVTKFCVFGFCANTRCARML